ncbi:MAG TPA: ATP-binding protein [Anaerolineae bacterium]|nr:ATP-binding protein [Anaerolineae bacterium]
MTQDSKTSSSREHVLVVDDTKRIRDFLIEYVLSPQGFHVTVASDGQEGLEKARAEKPDLIIVDNQMPRLTGLELLQQINKDGLNIPSIMMTAHGSEAIAVEAFRLGVRDYIVKPFNVENMASAIERALREKRLEKERDHLNKQLVDSNLQLQRRVQELNMLYGIGKTVSASLKLDDVIQRVVEGAIHLTGADECSLMLLDDNRTELYVRAAKNLDTKTQSLRIKVTNTFAGETLRVQKPLNFTPNQPKHAKFLQSQGLQALLYIPIVAHTKALGLLSLANRKNPNPFSEREQRILSPMVDFVGITLHNARLFSQMEYERHRLQALISQTNDPILLINEKGRLEMLNTAASIALNLPVSSSINQPITQLIEDESILKFFTQLEDENFVSNNEITVDDGRVFNANMTLVRGVGRSVFMRDISNMKEVDQLKTELVHIVSHDLRSPLTSILGYVELLRRVGDVNEQQEEFIKRIQINVQNITTLITDLLDLGRLESGMTLNLAPCDLTQLLHEISEEQHASVALKEQTFIFDVPPLPVLNADRNRLHQAFSNLISNAIKYSPEKAKVEVKGYAQEGQIIITITDTGIGIAPEDQAHIFDKFYRADRVQGSHQGTGLGLSIVKSVIEKHNGRIWVQSELGKGSRFFVVLPPTTDVAKQK